MTCHRLGGKRLSLQMIVLEGQKLRICELQKKFQLLSFSHIYRQSNAWVDQLCKKALGFVEGIVFYEEYMNHSKIPSS